MNINNKKTFINWFKKNFKIILIICIIFVIIAVILLMLFLAKKYNISNLDKINISSNNHSSNSKNSDDSSSNINNEEEQYIILPTKEKIFTKFNYYTNEMFIYKEICYEIFLILFLRALSESVDIIKNY